MRKKFEVFYSTDHPDPEKAGKKYKPTGKDMLVMNSDGVFFVFNGEAYYPSIRPLVDKIGNYDVKWRPAEVEPADLAKLVPYEEMSELDRAAFDKRQGIGPTDRSDVEQRLNRPRGG